MADHETLISAKTPDRLPVVWQSAEKRVNDLKLGLPGKIQPDLKKLQEKMTKSGKPGDFVIEFKGDKFALKFSTGSDSTLLATLDFAAEKDVATRRKWLQSLRDHTELVSKGDLDKFDKAHPAPPDPAEVKKLRDAYALETTNVRTQTDIVKSLPKKWKGVSEGLREVGFLHWGEGKGIGPWIAFLTAAENGRSVDSLVKDFLDPKITPRFKMQPATRAAIDAALQAGKTPDLSRLRTEVEQMLDSGFVARFSTDTKAALEKSIKEAGTRAKAAADKLKAMGVGVKP